MTTATFPRPSISDAKAQYRLGVICHGECGGVAREFVYDTGHWVCTACRCVEVTWERKVAVRPWVREVEARQ